MLSFLVVVLLREVESGKYTVFSFLMVVLLLDGGVPMMVRELASCCRA
jgi:hypothetical protein